MSFSYFLFIQIKPEWIYNLVCTLTFPFQEPEQCLRSKTFMHYSSLKVDNCARRPQARRPLIHSGGVPKVFQRRHMASTQQPQRLHLAFTTKSPARVSQGSPGHMDFKYLHKNTFPEKCILF